MRETIAVVIPAFNRAAWLAEALASVRAQTLAADEIIVVDDGSTEDIGAVCAGFAGVQYLHQPNQGVSAARNRGLERVKSDFVVFLDNDDRLHPCALETGLAAFGGDPSVGFVFGRAQPVDAEGRAMHWDLPDPPREASYATLLAGDHIVAPAAFLARTRAVRAVGGFNRRFHAAEECDLWRRIARDWTVVHHGAVVFDYRIHGKNTSANAARMLAGTLEMQDSHWAHVSASGRADYVEAFHRGRRFWVQLYGPDLVPQAVRALGSLDLSTALRAFSLALRHYPRGFADYPVDRTRWLLRGVGRRLGLSAAR